VFVIGGGERILRVTIEVVDGARPGTDSERSVDLEEVTNVLKVRIKVNRFREGWGAGHARWSAARRRAQSRTNKLARLLAHHRRLSPLLVF
jgi:hypothetical protein